MEMRPEMILFPITNHLSKVFEKGMQNIFIAGHSGQIRCKSGRSDRQINCAPLECHVVPIIIGIHSASR